MKIPRLNLAALAVLLLAAPTLAASKAETLAAGFDRGAEGAGLDARWLAGAVMVLAAGVALALVAVKLRRRRRTRRESVAGVGRDLGRHLRLNRRQRRCLKLAAEELGVGDPTTLLLCPSLLRHGRRRLPAQYGSDADLILRRLAA